MYAALKNKVNDNERAPIENTERNSQILQWTSNCLPAKLILLSVNHILNLPLDVLNILFIDIDLLLDFSIAFLHLRQVPCQEPLSLLNLLRSNGRAGAPSSGVTEYPKAGLF